MCHLVSLGDAYPAVAVSAVARHHPDFQAALELCREEDTLAVTKLDHLARTTRVWINLVFKAGVVGIWWGDRYGKAAIIPNIREFLRNNFDLQGRDYK